jgi:hypothetical protein
MPAIVLCDKHPEGWRRWTQAGGVTDRAATRLMFNAPRLPQRDAEVLSVIAHELGHVRIIAAGYDLGPPIRCRIDYILSPDELAANLLMNLWGFRISGSLNPLDHRGFFDAVFRMHPNHPVLRWVQHQMRGRR